MLSVWFKDENKIKADKMPSQVNRKTETDEYIKQVEENSKKGVPMPDSLRSKINKIGLE